MVDAAGAHLARQRTVVHELQARKKILQARLQELHQQSSHSEHLAEQEHRVLNQRLRQLLHKHADDIETTRQSMNGTLTSERASRQQSVLDLDSEVKSLVARRHQQHVDHAATVDVLHATRSKQVQLAAERLHSEALQIRAQMDRQYSHERQRRSEVLNEQLRDRRHQADAICATIAHNHVRACKPL